MSLLEVKELKKQYAARTSDKESPWIIGGLSFSVRRGEFLTIVGPSGSGKSTLLNILSQVDVASAGDIVFDGTSVVSTDANQLRPGLDCRIGYVTQDDNLLPWRSCLDNVLFPLEAQGRLDATGRDRARSLMSAVNLTAFADHYPHELSGGMRKRASLIRTLVYDPPIILMDEPFGALDAQTRVQLQEDLLELWRVGKKTIIFVTHDIGEAIALGDRTLTLSRAPMVITGEHVIDLPRPRNIRDIFATPGFSELYQKIRAEVR